jgi:hypothetical protein
MFLLVEQAGEPEGSAPNQYQMESSDDEAEEVETEQKALLTDWLSNGTGSQMRAPNKSFNPHDANPPAHRRSRVLNGLSWSWPAPLLEVTLYLSMMHLYTYVHVTSIDHWKQAD